MAKRKPVVVHIIWGEKPEDGQKATTYGFKTVGERNAFLDGIREGQGWEDYCTTDHADDVWCDACEAGHVVGQCRTMHACDNCGEEWYDSQLVPAKSLSERVDPGGPMPSGECPDCGALCYPVDADV